jgi:putative flippase GtrA
MRRGRPATPETGLDRLLRTTLQYARFGLVGLGATLVHVLVYAGLIEFLALAPLPANTLGFAAGVNLSFLGHRHWTFRGEAAADASAEARWAFGRFAVVALFGLALNTLFVRLVTGTAGLHYAWSIPLIAGATPVCTFVLGKYWAFRG